METAVRQLLEEKIAQIEKRGHGEVIIKIQNGYIWRILATCDILIGKLEKEHNAKVR